MQIAFQKGSHPPPRKARRLRKDRSGEEHGNDHYHDHDYDYDDKTMSVQGFTTCS